METKKKKKVTFIADGMMGEPHILDTKRKGSYTLCGFQAFRIDNADYDLDCLEDGHFCLECVYKYRPIPAELEESLRSLWGQYGVTKIDYVLDKLRDEERNKA